MQLDMTKKTFKLLDKVALSIACQELMPRAHTKNRTPRTYAKNRTPRTAWLLGQG
jgi:hypothetical protein